MKSLNIFNETKTRFDNVQVQESAKAGKQLTQEETQKILITLWEQVEAGVLEAKPK